MKIPAFYGNKKDTVSADQWVSTVDRAAAIAELNDARAADAAVDAIRGPAYTWWENLTKGSAAEQTTARNWTTLKAAFLKRFRVAQTVGQKVHMLTGLRMNKEETVHAFYDRVDNVVKANTHEALNGITGANADHIKAGFVQCRELLGKQLFVAGLTTAAKAWVETQGMTDATPADQIIQWADAAITAHGRQSLYSVAAVGVEMEPDAEPAQKGNRGQVSEEALKQEIAALQRQLPKQPSKKAKDGSNGGGRGRGRGGRGRPPMQQRERWVFCFRCKQWGVHYSDECRVDPEKTNLPPQDENVQPSGPAKDAQYPN